METDDICIAHEAFHLNSREISVCSCQLQNAGVLQRQVQQAYRDPMHFPS